MQQLSTDLSKLSNEELDRKVAELQGWVENWSRWFKGQNTQEFVIPVGEYHPTTNREQAMELLEKFKIDVGHINKDRWEASITRETEWYEAPTPMRAIVIAVIAYLQEKSDE